MLHVLVLAEHLKLNPHSRVFALQRGDIGWMGWDAATEITANQFDQTASLIAGLGGAKSLDPEHLYPRPGAAAATAAAAETIADFNIADFYRFMFS